MRLVIRLLLASSVAATLLPQSAFGAGPLPTITLKSLAVKRTALHHGFAGRITVRVRLCLSVGPKAVTLTTETRKMRGITKAQAASRDPLGVDLTRVYPYDCADNYLLSWAVPARLFVGGGTYAANIRVRDGYGRLSSPVIFSLRL